MESSCAEDVAIVRLGPQYGSVQVGVLRELEQRLTAGISRASIGLIVDLGETIYIGCGLLNVLLRCHQRANRLNRRVVLCRPKPLTRRVLAITQLDSLWELSKTRHATIEAAHRSLLGVEKGTSHYGQSASAGGS